MSRPLALLVVGPALALASCATRVPQVLTPQIVPKTFIAQTRDSAPTWPREDWWHGFGSPELSELLQTAQVENRNLTAAAARVMEAQAQTFIARSALLPQFELNAQAQRSGVGHASVSSTGQSPGATGNSFLVDAAASYELDLWGLARANLLAAEEALKSSRFARQSLALSITAEVADTYFSVLALRERVAIANDDIAAINDILNAIKLRVSTGTSSDLELAQEQAQVESVEGELPVLEEQELEARVALAVLIGRPPEGFDVNAHGLAGIGLPGVAAGIPSQLLVRRPDVAEAEANLASAHANVDAARAAFLPQISLTGSAGFASTAVKTLLRGPSFLWDVGAGLIQTIFDGQLIGQKRLASATERELVSSYQAAVLNAYADVESALGQVRSSAEAENHLGREVDAAREAFAIAQLQYREGAADLLTVLQAQQTLFGARDQLAQARLARLQAVVHLYEALGGGWVEPPQERTQFAARAE